MYYSSHTSEHHDRAVTIRRAAADEWDAIDHLAQLDSAPPPPRETMLVAEVEGEMRAAVAIRNGYAIADPFAQSGDLLALLRARAQQLREESASQPSGWRTTGLRLARASSRRRTGVV
jgi:hypothetical protein